ncbi:MAG: NADH-quinone oxidoreductase subunit NuoB [Deltaproteobacteria bacterium]|nr:NADH-quinone oxidoreductase subunit NuoB [Deltaproteobacteria bacterium]MBW2444796.1 NADH-quinone oxidoreductase subunit NuoB [Deltaproteobacteria bacterium]
MPIQPETRHRREAHEFLRQGGETFQTTRLEDALAWARKYSMFMYPFVTACCGMEFMSVAGPRYDLDRFGCALPRFSPRQADLLWVVGTISHRQAPILKKVYDQMTEPKWVIAFGACTTSGGPYNNYSTVQGIDTIIPVDLYIPGCPPRPEAVLDGLMKLQDRVQLERVPADGRHREIADLELAQPEKPVA